VFGVLIPFSSDMAHTNVSTPVIWDRRQFRLSSNHLYWLNRQMIVTQTYHSTADINLVKTISF